jgi:hypothetical protein
MKRFLIFLIVAFGVTASVALAADGETGKSPAQFCNAELTKLGAKDFKSLYSPTGSTANAFGKCVSKHAQAAKTNRTNAAKACTAEQAMPEADFRAAHSGQSFNEFYGKNDNDRNAYGKCVSSKAKTANAQQEAKTLNAAKACKAERTADRVAFVAKYGGKASSAFGKCVSSKSKTK